MKDKTVIVLLAVVEIATVAFLWRALTRKQEPVPVAQPVAVPAIPPALEFTPEQRKELDRLFAEIDALQRANNEKIEEDINKIIKLIASAPSQNPNDH